MRWFGFNAAVVRENEETLWRTLYEETDHRFPSSHATEKRRPIFKFKVGDKVRLSMSTQPFRKGYLPKWTEEIFEVSHRISRIPPVYKVKDFEGEDIKGTFYEEELQKIIKTDNMYRIERVLKKRTRNGKKQYFVKWMGYPDKFSSWVDQVYEI